MVELPIVLSLACSLFCKLACVVMKSEIPLAGERWKRRAHSASARVGVSTTPASRRLVAGAMGDLASSGRRNQQPSLPGSNSLLSSKETPQHASKESRKLIYFSSFSCPPCQIFISLQPTSSLKKSTEMRFVPEFSCRSHSASLPGTSHLEKSSQRDSGLKSPTKHTPSM